MDIQSAIHSAYEASNEFSHGTPQSAYWIGVARGLRAVNTQTEVNPVTFALPEYLAKKEIDGHDIGS